MRTAGSDRLLRPPRGPSRTPRAQGSVVEAGAQGARFSLSALVTSALAIACVVVASSPRPARASSTVTFESGQVRPLALSPDGTRLYAVNTPDGRLEVLDVTSSGLARRASVTVGLEPVAVAARSNSEVWVVNHLSDSLSVVDVASDPPRVVRTQHMRRPVGSH